MTTPAQRGPRWELVAVGVLFLLVATYFGLGAGLSFVRQRRASRHYVPVAAVLTRATLDERGGARTTSGGSVVLTVAYRYRVEGRDYESTRVAWTPPGFANRAAAEAALAELQARDGVSAFYDPADPTRAVLDASPPPASLLLAPVGLAAPGLAACLVGLRRSRGSAVVLLLVVGVGCRQPPDTSPPPRNIVLITIDTLRADRVGRGVAPELDALAAASVRFSHARTAVPLTLPAHVTLLTGRLPTAHGVHLNGEVLPEDVPTLASALKGAGYATAAFVGAYVLDRRFGVGRGFDVYDDRVRRDPARADRLEAERPAAAVVDAALAWLDAAAGGPFFLWVHLYDPHAPYAPPEPFRSRFADRPYDGEVAYASAEAGRLLARLDARGLSPSTIVVVAGDHGEGLGEHGEATHGMLAYDSTLRVPLLVKAPGLAPATNDAAVSLADVSGSLLRLAGAGVELPGASTGLLDAANRAAEVYAETEYPLAAGWHPLYVLAGTSRKLIRSSALELYDVAADAAESTNLVATETAHARAAVARLAGLAATPRRTGAVSGDAQAALRSLGYVSAPSGARVADTAPNPASVIQAWTRFEQATTGPAALETLAALTRDFPDGLVFVTSYARALGDAGRWPDATRLLRAAAQRFPAESSVFQDLSVAARESGDTPEALRAAQAACALDGSNAAAHDGLGLLHAQAGRSAEAAAAFTRATTLDPSNATYWANLGNARLAMDDLPGADAAYGRALDADPEHVDAANGRGVILVRTNRATDAVPWLTRALSHAPDFHEARLNLAVAYLQSNQRTRAIEALRELLRRAPRRAVRERQAAEELLRSLR